MRLWIVGNCNDNGTSPLRICDHSKRARMDADRSLFQSEGSSHPEGQGDAQRQQPRDNAHTASEGQVANLLKKVQEGEITMKEAEQMVGLKTLKNHRTYKSLPTPRASEIMHQKLTPKLAARAADYGNLEEAVATTMWPTPMASEGFKQTKKWREDHQNSLTAWVFNPDKNPQMFSTPTKKWITRDTQ